MHEESNENLTPAASPEPESTAASESVPAADPARAASTPDGEIPPPASESVSPSPDGENSPPESDGGNSPPSTEPRIAQLTGARMPSDRGLSGLGLLMQLGGTIGVTFAAVLAIAATFGGGAGQATGVLFLFAILSGVRSAYHRAAGTSILYGKDSAPTKGVQTYLWVAFGHSVICLLILENYTDAKTLFQFGALFLGWPATLLVYFSLPHIKKLIAGGVPDSEDHGFEGAGVLMTVFGIMGTLFAGLVLMQLLDHPDAAFATPASGIIVLVFITLVVRSVIHAVAGFKGISGVGFDEANASAARYYNLGIISAICIGITLFVVLVMSTRHMGIALIVGVFAFSMLLAWPNILRRLYAERNFNVFLAGSDAPTYQRAPDAGLIALGWTLVAVAVLGLGQSLAEALLAKPMSSEELAILASMAGDEGLALIDRSAWWSVGIGGLQLWAGIELIRMSERHKLAAMIYGGVTTAVTIYLVLPVIDRLDAVFAGLLGGDAAAMITRLMTGAVGFNLILAIGAMILVNRVTMPSAVVHIRKKKS